MADEWMTVHDAMTLLGVSKSRIYELKNDGTFRSEKAGGTVKLNAEDVRKYADKEKKPGWPSGQPRRKPKSG